MVIVKFVILKYTEIACLLLKPYLIKLLIKSHIHVLFFSYFPFTEKIVNNYQFGARIVGNKCSCHENELFA